MNDSQTYVEMNVITLIYLVVDQSLVIYSGSRNHLNIKRSSPGENLEEWRAALWVRRWRLASAVQQWIFFFFWPCCAVLVPQPGIKSRPVGVKVLSPNPGPAESSLQSWLSTSKLNLASAASINGYWLISFSASTQIPVNQIQRKLTPTMKRQVLSLSITDAGIVGKLSPFWNYLQLPARDAATEVCVSVF